MNGPKDRAEVELGFIAAKASALREGLLSRGDPTKRASLEEEREALEKMSVVLAGLLASSIYINTSKPKKHKKGNK